MKENAERMHKNLLDLPKLWARKCPGLCFYESSGALTTFPNCTAIHARG